MSERPKIINFQEEKDRRARVQEAQTKEGRDTFEFAAVSHQDSDSGYAFGPQDARDYAQNLLLLLGAGRDIMLQEYGKQVDLDQDVSMDEVEQVFERNRDLRKGSLERVADEVLIGILENHKKGRGEHGFATVVAAAEILLGRNA